MFRVVRAHPSRIRLFQNKWLELTTLTPLPVFLGVWLPVAILMVVVAFRENALMTAAIGLIAGGAVWAGFEYLAHRYIFHLNLSSRLGRHMIFLIHGNHHADPADPLRSIMPLTVTIPLGLLIWLACHAAGDTVGDAVFAGFVMGYISYDFVHWSCHQTRAHGRLALALRRHHLLHHYARRDGNYATTVPMLDRLFHTRIRSR
ncbi:sterol desaturase family protein [Tanticharoenia sakaeratensis]|uniref:Ceramide very long chain fatty acid hydroxylase-like protein C19G12.08 n=1 Tax=Tanticharoenia sakaeratensis NBRC 103193 TaxID=1231623 RepID=A0A0D6MN36_9PROT|nr:sterol desaturase family protein [Tanticharoenia sakaeratensis]GAN54805.1 ceramide very long chain fatty acid hydroxylase-like protein C19G12.08 [Tanticharoenia sakaeratensis NBRC 103193]GBQ21506.1 sterol desaturase [Tanticharoenia sakaeratensis NBRC 103193]